MGSINDFFSPASKQGLVGSGWATSINPGGYVISGKNYDVGLDTVWAKTYEGNGSGSNTASPYYDYFYSGQDIIVTVDGTEDDPNFRVLPIINFGYSITQNKSPVYGFWSYTMDAVLRGTRIVQGTCTIATRYPNYMKDLIAKSAQNRQTKGSGSYNYFKPLTEDDQNIEKYWGKNMDPSLASLGTSIYSVHPPFSFVIVYGYQPTSVNTLDGEFDQFAADNAWMIDTNERLVETDASHNTDRMIIDDVEIQSYSTEYGPDGSVVSETYQWFARDCICP